MFAAVRMLPIWVGVLAVIGTQVSEVRGAARQLGSAAAEAAGGLLAPQGREARRIQQLEQRLLELERENEGLRASSKSGLPWLGGPDSRSAELPPPALTNEMGAHGVSLGLTATQLSEGRAYATKLFGSPTSRHHLSPEKAFLDGLRPVLNEKNYPEPTRRKLQAGRQLQARRNLQGNSFRHAANACPFGGSWNMGESMDPLGSAYSVPC
jgi:hypothetical protein